MSTHLAFEKETQLSWEGLAGDYPLCHSPEWTYDKGAPPPGKGEGK
jgi:hypothetical protein